MQHTVTLRSAVRADFPAVDALLARAYPRSLQRDYPPSTIVLALPIISRARPDLVGCGTYYVAEAQGEILGAGGWTRAGRSQIGEVRHLVTDDRRQRQGIGRAMMDHIFDEARRGGIVTLGCLATLTAVPFYTGMGFTTIGPHTVQLRPGITFSTVRMQRRL